MKKIIIAVLLLNFSSTLLASELSIMACSDKIEALKKKHNSSGPGKAADKICEYTDGDGSDAVFDKKKDWACSDVEDYLCEGESSLKMISCVRAYECD
ncbi:MAG TPA: hypothetical protein VNJ01_11625 [Bacteriovoracaceae bacterium]|nr:hypothetical protein [Bacteriovoracaceae bacterium]